MLLFLLRKCPLSVIIVISHSPLPRERIVMRPAAVEFLVHMSLCAAVASVNSLAEDGLIDRPLAAGGGKTGLSSPHSTSTTLSRSEHIGAHDVGKDAAIRYHRVDHTSITGAKLDLQWRQLQNVEYLTDGGNSWIHTAVYNGKPIVVKTLKPECQDLALAINEIEAELCKFEYRRSIILRMLICLPNLSFLVELQRFIQD
jgi:hypothetical protein